MNRLGKLAAAALLTPVTSQAEAKDAGATAPVIAERCTVQMSSPRLTKLATDFNSELSHALESTPQEINELERDAALEFAKTAEKLDFKGIRLAMAQLDKKVVLEDEDSIRDASTKLADLSAKINTMTQVLDLHSQRSLAGNYDPMGFIFTDQDVIARDVPEVFATFEKKGLACPSNVQSYVVQHGEFPGAGDLITTLVKSEDVEPEKSLLPEAPNLGPDLNASKLKTPKALFLESKDSVLRNLDRQESRAQKLVKYIREKYSKSN